MKAFRLIPPLLLLLLLSGTHPDKYAYLEPELKKLRQRGYTYQYIDPHRIKVENEITGQSISYALNGPNLQEVELWASGRGVPILVIDPSQIDTNLYREMYTYWATVPVAGYGLPLVAGDVDRNGKPEAYGYYYQRAQSDEYYTRAYEIDNSGQSVLRHDYGQWAGNPRHIVDTDRDGLFELMMDSVDRIGPSFLRSSLFEQPMLDSMPIVFRFSHRHAVEGAASKNQFIGSLDADSLVDFLYVGNDSSTQLQFVAEFDPGMDNFTRRWSTNWGLQSGSTTYQGYGVGDFDGDGRMEFTTSSTYGHLWVVENIQNDNFEIVWQDSLPFWNMYWNTAGDVDDDGNLEFFTGASDFPSGSTWTVIFEADSNNSYSPRFMIRYLGASFAYPTYRTADVDNDGRLELILMIAGSVMIFKSAADDSYYLWFYRRFSYGDTVLFYDFVGDEKLEFAVSLTFTNMQPRDQTWIWRPTGISMVKEPPPDGIPRSFTLYQNFPNPFNPLTKIRYSISNPGKINLKVINVLGEQIVEFVQNHFRGGDYEIEVQLSNVSSGVYFLRATYLSIGGFSTTRTIKVLLLK